MVSCISRNEMLLLLMQEGLKERKEATKEMTRGTRRVSETREKEREDKAKRINIETSKAISMDKNERQHSMQRFE